MKVHCQRLSMLLLHYVSHTPTHANMLFYSDDRGHTVYEENEDEHFFSNCCESEADEKMLLEKRCDCDVENTRDRNTCMGTSLRLHLDVWAELRHQHKCVRT